MIACIAFCRKQRVIPATSLMSATVSCRALRSKTCRLPSGLSANMRRRSEELSTMKAMDHTAILLLAHGTPDTLDEIPEYLRNVTGGRALPQAAIDEITHRYSLIGKSPLTDITMTQARLLERHLGLPVYVGMRNWSPYIATAVRGCARVASPPSRRSALLRRTRALVLGSIVARCLRKPATICEWTSQKPGQTIRCSSKRSPNGCAQNIAS